MISEPLTLTSSVPHGNASPNRRALTPESQKRAMPPKALPMPIQK